MFIYSKSRRKERYIKVDDISTKHAILKETRLSIMEVVNSPKCVQAVPNEI